MRRAEVEDKEEVDGEIPEEDPVSVRLLQDSPGPTTPAPVPVPEV